MRKIYTVQSETELAYLKALLDGEQIPYHVHNDHFGSMSVGPSIPLFNARSIMVRDEHTERALRLIREYLDLHVEAPRSLSQRLRNLIEVVLFGWFVPGGSRRREKSEPRDTRAAPRFAEDEKEPESG